MEREVRKWGGGGGGEGANGKGTSASDHVCDGTWTITHPTEK